LSKGDGAARKEEGKAHENIGKSCGLVPTRRALSIILGLIMPQRGGEAEGLSLTLCTLQPPFSSMMMNLDSTMISRSGLRNLLYLFVKQYRHNVGDVIACPFKTPGHGRGGRGSNGNSISAHGSRFFGEFDGDERVLVKIIEVGCKLESTELTQFIPSFRTDLGGNQSSGEELFH
jgi:hypothetical protein